MPKSFSPDLFSQETKNRMIKANKQGDYSSNTKAQILKGDINYIGEGGRVVVAATETDSDILVAISMKEVQPAEAKTVYYNQKILKILFPYNFPSIYAAFGRTEQKGISVNFRERVHGRQFTKKEAEIIHSGNVVSSKEYPFSNVIKVIKNLGVGIYFDKNNRNYMINDYKDEIFVDTINYN